MVGDMGMDEVTTLDMEDIHMVVGLAMGSGNGSGSLKASMAKLSFLKSCIIT